MTSYKISLNTIAKVKSFVQAITVFDCDIDLACGKYLVDAKSIMGIFSLDLSKDLNLIVRSDADAGAVEEAIREYLVD